MPTDSLPKWLRWCYLALFGLLPWSVEWPVGSSWNLTVPAEPLITLTGFGVLAALLRSWPIHLTWLARVSFAWIAWQALAAVVSTMPLVSWKYWLVEAGQWAVFFAGLFLWPRLWPQLIRVFSYSLAGVAIYILVHHAFYQFRADQVMLATRPFFPDHTLYGAVLVLTLPGCALLLTKPIEGFYQTRSALLMPLPEMAGKHTSPGISAVIGSVVLAIFVLAICFTFSRAVWLTLLAVIFVGAALYFQKYWRWFMLVFLLLAGIGLAFRAQIAARLNADVSSMERLNRYSCAFRMARDRPWAGFGPGTFQFQYLPYQRTEEMTRISITEPIIRRGPHNNGRGGGAHSEYFQALTETGWPGLLGWLLLAAGSLFAGIRLYRRTGQLYWLALTLSLLSFFLHGLVNNFLHDARVAALVWGQMAVLLSGLKTHGTEI